MKKRIKILISRLKNVWAWSAYHPSNPPRGFEWVDTKTNPKQYTQFIEAVSFKEKFEQAKNIDNLLEDN